jgi:hypothetical protein
VGFVREYDPGVRWEGSSGGVPSRTAGYCRNTAVAGRTCFWEWCDGRLCWWRGVCGVEGVASRAAGRRHSREAWLRHLISVVGAGEVFGALQ